MMSGAVDRSLRMSRAQRVDDRPGALHALIQPEGTVERSLVLHADTAGVPVRDERSQHRCEIDVADAELAELSVVKTFQVSVRDERPHDVEGRARIHASTLEIDRV